MLHLQSLGMDCNILPASSLLPHVYLPSLSRIAPQAWPKPAPQPVHLCILGGKRLNYLEKLIGLLFLLLLLFCLLFSFSTNSHPLGTPLPPAVGFGGHNLRWVVPLSVTHIHKCWFSSGAHYLLTNITPLFYLLPLGTLIPNSLSI